MFARLPAEFHDIKPDNEWVLGQPGARSAPVLEGPSFDRNGNLYCVDVPGGRIYRIDATGQFELIVAYDGWPNGLKIASDGRIFVADYKYGLMLLDPVARANAIWRVPLMKDGSVAKVGAYIQLLGGGGADGLALDEDGRLAVAHVGLGTVGIFDAWGEPVYRIRSCEGMLTTSLAFGGVNRKTLYITEAESLSVLQARLDMPGKRLPSHPSPQRGAQKARASFCHRRQREKLAAPCKARTG